MATSIASILVEVRAALLETTANFWSDTELTRIFRHGALDLWGALLDLHAEHYYVVDETHCSILANTGYVTGVPADCFRVQLIEPRDTTTAGTFQGLAFLPRRFNHPDFVDARAAGVCDTGGGVIFYNVTGEGSPIAAPRILTAPLASSDIPLRLVYNPSLVIDVVNPVPGESDHALIHWVLAFARAKERDDKMPDPGALAVYQTEKQAILVRCTPRQEQEPEVVEGLFEGMGGF